MTKAKKNSLFGSKIDKRAQAQKLKKEEQTLNPKSVNDGAEFKLFVEDWESRIGRLSSSHGKAADAIQARTSLSSDPEHQLSSSTPSSSSHSTLTVPVADEVYEMGDIETLAELQFQDFPTVSDIPDLQLPSRPEGFEGDGGMRPGGTEIIELESPIELDRLTEFPKSTSRNHTEQGKKNPFSKKEKTKKITLAKLPLKKVSATSDKPMLPPIEKAKCDKECRPGGTEVIELENPVELDRLRELPESTPREKAEQKNRFRRKEKTMNVRVVARSGE